MLPLQANYVPKRIRPCPKCGDKDRVQYVVEGMPARPPNPEEENRLLFVGCVIDVEVDEDGNVASSPRWRCPSCDHWYR